MKSSYDKSTPIELEPGEWHLPYVTTVKEVDKDGFETLYYYDNDGSVLSTQEAKEASAARCARSSYDTHDGSKALYEKPLEKGRDDKTLFQDLITSKPTHGSPAEHQATPMKNTTGLQCRMKWLEKPLEGVHQETSCWEEGVTHLDSNDCLWSGNFKGWIQHRQLLKDHCKWDEVT